jgi:hypothetical protein
VGLEGLLNQVGTTSRMPTFADMLGIAELVVLLVLRA